MWKTTRQNQLYLREKGFKKKYIEFHIQNSNTCIENSLFGKDFVDVPIYHGDELHAVVTLVLKSQLALCFVESSQSLIEPIEVYAENTKAYLGHTAVLQCIFSGR